MRVGAIDIGSNSIRLLVADLDTTQGPWGPVITIARAGEVCRLGRGLHESGRIDPDLAERAGVLAAEFVRRAHALGAVHVVVGATAALRSAENGPEVQKVIQARCGLPVRVLTGDEEARLVYRSVTAGLGQTARHSSCLVFDLGGGSTEVVSGVGEAAGRWTSLPFGAVSLTERYLRSDPPTTAEIDLLTREVESVVMHQCASMPDRAPVLAGVGGTVTVMASMDRHLEVYEPSLLEGWMIPKPRLDALIASLVRSSREERRGWTIIGEGRADIIAAGALVIGVLARRFPSGGLVCSTQGLRYGLVRVAAEETLRAVAPDPPAAH